MYKNCNKCKALSFRHGRLRLRGVAAFLLAALVSACASGRSPENFGTVYDPLEPLNRSIFKINQAADFLVIRPVSATYRQVVPDPLQDMVTNFLRNLQTPVILLNEVLQGDWEGAEVALTRFFLNSSVGVGGLVDIAGYGNPELAYRSEDFGQTLGVWGVGDGPYLVLPLLGPSNVRDGFGRVVDVASDPLTYVESDTLRLTRTGLTVVDARSRSLDALDEIERSSIDFYAAIRSLYWQSRRSEIYDGAPPVSQEFPEFEDFEDFQDPVDSNRWEEPRAPDTGPLLSEAVPPPAMAPAELILDLEPLRD